MKSAPHAQLLGVLLALPLGSASCKETPLESGQVATFADFCDAKFDLPEGAYGDTPLTRVTIEGYPIAPKMFSLCSKTCSFDLAQNRDGSGGSIRFSVRLGTGKNELAPLPERFEPGDFKLRTNTDSTLGFGDRVRLTGGRLGTSNQDNCQLYGVDLIEVP